MNGNTKVPWNIVIQVALIVFTVALAIGGYKVAMTFTRDQVQENKMELAKQADKDDLHTAKIAQHDTGIALVQQDVKYIKQGIDRIETQLSRGD